MFLIESLNKILNVGDARSIKAKKNILAMLFIKGGNILLGLLIIPLTLNYVDNKTYGLWLTLSSMVAWMNFFDIGINNGLKNKLAEAFAVGDTQLGKQYVSTTYALLSLIFIPLMVILLIATPYMHWQNILKIQMDDNKVLILSISLIIVYFCANYILSTINVVLSSDQRPAGAAFQSFLQQVVTVLLIVVFTYTTEGSLLNLCIALCLAPIIVVLIFNFTLFRGRYKEISPSIKTVNFKLAPSLFKLGIQFFIIQIAGIIQFQLTNFLIIRNYGAADVTAYNVSYKYFTTAYMVWGILITPLWTACTDAYVRGDIIWIRNAIKKYTRLMIIFILVAIVLLLISNPVYHFWVGDKVNISFTLSFWMMIYMIVLIFSGLFVTILNGCGQLKVQSIACIFSPLVFIGCFELGVNLNIGVCGVLIASIIANFNGILLAPIQCYKMLRVNH